MSLQDLYFASYVCVYNAVYDMFSEDRFLLFLSVSSIMKTPSFTVVLSHMRSFT
jgi:hypothetical protein